MASLCEITGRHVQRLDIEGMTMSGSHTRIPSLFIELASLDNENMPAATSYYLRTLINDEVNMTAK